MKPPDIENISNSELSEVIDEWVKSEIARKMLKDHYINGKTFETIAEKFSMSPRQTARIIYKNEIIVFKKLNLI